MEKANNWWVDKNNNNWDSEIYTKPKITASRKRQMVIRTYPKGWTQTTNSLQNLLTDGWLVVHITPLEGSITEYIVEKEIDEY